MCVFHVNIYLQNLDAQTHYIWLYVHTLRTLQVDMTAFFSWVWGKLRFVFWDVSSFKELFFGSFLHNPNNFHEKKISLLFSVYPGTFPEKKAQSLGLQHAQHY